jgi:hypothetical protein
VIQRLSARPFFRDIIFCVALAMGMLVVCWDSTLTKDPSEPHQWRQSDCISIAQYYAAGAPFLEPEMHSRISDDGRSGKTIAEFPVLYYAVGKIWSVTGVQFWIFRLCNALFCVVALLCLYRTLLRITKSWFWSALGPLLLLSSPVYAYYGISFLTNVPALNCVIIAWYFIAKYYSEPRNRYLVFAVALFTLAGLLKISSLTSYVMLTCIYGLELFRFVRFKQEGRLFVKPLLAGALLLLPLLITLSWYLGYVEYYCTLHGGRYSVSAPDPVWHASEQTSAKFWSVWFGFTSRQIFSPYIWFAALAGTAFLFTKFRTVNPFWLIAIPLVFFGHSVFALLFFYSLDGHDYYHIDLLVFFLLVYAALAKYISAIQQPARSKTAFRIAGSALVVWSLLSCNHNMNLRFFGGKDHELLNRLFANAATVDYLTMATGHEWLRRPYDEIADELDRRGFSDSTVVYSAYDASFNITLVKLRRPGFTNMLDCWTDSSWTAWRIERGAELLLVEVPERPFEGISEFMDYPLFQVGHVGVYDLRPYRSVSRSE